MKRFNVRKVAVLGAGVMGAQIAAHLVNANVETLLFELPAKEGDPNGNVNKALDGLKKLDPAPISAPSRITYIQPANYEQHLELLRDCDLIIEAIAERMDWKSDLYRKVAPFVNANAIFATNTSGLSINTLAEAFPENLRHRFCGIHFFNPPRYMHLVELIPCKGTEAQLLDQLETFLVSTVGKGVVRAKDTPNFIANRIGVFSMLATKHHAAGVQPRLRHGGCADRPLSRPPQERHLPHAGRGRPRRVRACGQHHAREPHRRSVAQAFRTAGLVQISGRPGRTGAENQKRHLPEDRQRDSRARSCTASNIACPTPRWTTA